MKVWVCLACEKEGVDSKEPEDKEDASFADQRMCDRHKQPKFLTKDKEETT